MLASRMGVGRWNAGSPGPALGKRQPVPCTVPCHQQGKGKAGAAFLPLKGIQQMAAAVAIRADSQRPCAPLAFLDACGLPLLCFRAGRSFPARGIGAVCRAKVAIGLRIRLPFQAADVSGGRVDPDATDKVVQRGQHRPGLSRSNGREHRGLPSAVRSCRNEWASTSE